MSALLWGLSRDRASAHVEEGESPGDLVLTQALAKSQTQSRVPWDMKDVLYVSNSQVQSQH